MDGKKAIKVLGRSICNDGGLYNLGHYMAWTKGDDEICLDCRFTTEELEAIVWWMKNN